MYAFRLAFLISSRHLYYVPFQNMFCLYCLFSFIFSGLACVVVFSYPVRWHFTWLTLEFAIIFGDSRASRGVQNVTGRVGSGRVRKLSKSHGSGRVGSGQEVSVKSHGSGRVGSGQEVFKSHVLGRVGSRGFQILRFGSGRVKSFSNLTGRVGISPVGSGRR